MNKQKHVSDLITDYVLGVLPEEKVTYLQTHLTKCSQCRLELWNERKFGTEVRNVFASISIPNEHQLDKLMPPISKIQAGWLQARNLKAGLAVASAIVIITLTTVGLRTGIGQNKWLTSSPTAYSTTTLVTDTPTQSLIATPSSDVPFSLTANTPEPQLPGDSPHPAIIPVPAATFLN